MAAFFSGATRAGRTGKSPINLYLLTITTPHRTLRLGYSIDGKTAKQTALGRAVERQLAALPELEENITFAKGVVMPNHIHVLFGLSESSALAAGGEMPDFAPLVARIKERAEAEYAYYTVGDKRGLWDAGFRIEPVLSESEKDAALRMIRQNLDQWKGDEFRLEGK